MQDGVIFGLIATLKNGSPVRMGVHVFGSGHGRRLRQVHFLGGLGVGSNASLSQFLFSQPASEGLVF
jgi:hypothetical protein